MTCDRGTQQLLDTRMTDGSELVGADVVKSEARKLHSDILRSSNAAWKVLQLRLGEQAAINMLSTGEVWRTMTSGVSFNKFVGDMWRDSNLPVPED